MYNLGVPHASTAVLSEKSSKVDRRPIKVVNSTKDTPSSYEIAVVDRKSGGELAMHYTTYVGLSIGVRSRRYIVLYISINIETCT